MRYAAMQQIILVIAALLSAVIICRAGAESDGFKFVSIGDWGDDATFVGSNLAKFFAEEAEGAPLGLLLGDNFYEFGVRSVDDHQWKQKYLEPFDNKHLEKTEFMVTGGNHDYYGNITAQILYTKKDPTKRWIFPSYYHARYYEQNGVKLYVVSVDTWRLNGGDTIVGFDANTGHKWLRSRAALKEAVAAGLFSARLASDIERNLPFDPDRKPVIDVAQYKWIESALKTASAVGSDWRIVIGHFPIHSASVFEHGDTESLTRLDQVLRANNVDAYFSGHDHILQISTRDGNLHYYGSGAGARRHPNVNKHYKGLKAYSSGEFGFMKHHATKSTLHTTLVTSEGDGLGSEKTYRSTYEQTKPAKADAGLLVEVA